MELDSAKFMEIQQRAKKIMDMDRNGQLDKYAKKQSGSINENGEIDFVQPTSLSNSPSANEIAQAPIRINNTKVPKAILESFKSNPINTNNMSSTNSILDTIGVPITTNIQEQKKKPIIQEQQIVSSQSIDYSLIKTIVEDCVKKSMSSMKKSLLNEGVLNSENNLALMRIGESFRFVTKNGDIFEAKLKKIGNVNDKK